MSSKPFSARELIARVTTQLDRKQTELATVRLGAIVESSDDAIVSKDLNGIITSWNPGAERMFGYSAAEAIGQSIRLIIPVDRQGEEDEVLRHVRAGEPVEHFETVRQRKDGSLVDISLSVSPIRARSGEIVGASKIARDISDRKQAEAAMKAANALKDQFLSLVSHELRTPISTVIANGTLLQRRSHLLRDEDRDQALADIVSEGGRLQSIIENLLLLSRRETPDGLELQPLSLRRLVAENVAAFTRRNPSRLLTVAETGDADRVHGQETLLAMVIDNLINNADKYSPENVPIEVLLKTNDLGETELHVCDGGIGVDEASRPNLFVPFFRTPSAREYARGMGLGLAVCKQVIEAHGGRIWVNSRPGGGSDFAFALPSSREKA